MAVDLTSLQTILGEIPDKTRVRRLISSWKKEALDQQTICWSQQKVIDLERKLDNHITTHSMTTTLNAPDELLTSKEACDRLKIGMTTLIAYKNAGLIQVENQIGNKHLFSRRHLDNFLQIPAHQRNMMLAEAPPKESRWSRKKKHKEEATDGPSLRIERNGSK